MPGGGVRLHTMNMPKDDPKDKPSKSGEGERDDSTERKDERVRPTDKKLPEGPDHLRQRQEWFKKRSGS